MYCAWMLKMLVTLGAIKLSLTTCCGNISTLEYAALNALYLSTNGSMWMWNHSMNPSSIWQFPSNLLAPCCLSWQGITCIKNDTVCKISSLILPSFGLRGTLPTEIGQLTSVNSLSLSGNHIFGELPAEISSMYSLNVLDLSNNFLVGTIPSSISLVTTLVELILNANNIEGEIISEIGSLTLLTKLFLNENTLKGSLPSEIGSLSSCWALKADTNRLSGTLPSEIGRLSNLTLLSLHSNRLSGCLPAEIGQLNSLTSFDVHLNLFCGSVPSEIGQMTALTYLRIGYNRLCGSLPVEIWQLKSFVLLYADNNLLTGTLAPEIGQLVSLTEFTINNNHLTGVLPTQIGLLLELIEFNVCHNSLSGVIPVEIGQLSALSTLSLFSNRLTGSVPTEMGQLTSMISFYIYLNILSGILPTELGRLSSMRRFCINSNHLSSTFPSEIWQLTGVVEFYINVNRFSGSISSNLGNLKELREVDFGDNSFTGSLPLGLWNLMFLVDIGLSMNNFVGSIPTETGNLTALIKIDLSVNCLTGSLPSEIGKLHLLQTLQLNENRFTGSIPSEIGQLTAVSYLHLFDNLFSGSVPTQVGHLVSVNSLLFSRNMLTNSIPMDFFSLPKLDILDLSDNQFSGSLPQNPIMNEKSNIVSVDVSLNFLSGRIVLPSYQLKVFNASFNQFSNDLELLFSQPRTLVELRVLDVSHNLLSGKLLDNWHTGYLNNLRTLMLNSNCFSGSISTNFTNILNLEHLILDAFGSAQGCDIRAPTWLNWIVKGLFLKHASSVGSVPKDIIQMKVLSTFHAAGNALTGTLPDLQSDSKLTDISLANNYLQGSIPISWQKIGRFVQLDLSNNKISGVLSSEFTIPKRLLNETMNSSLVAVYDLSDNRLSGDVPPTMYTAQGVNILEGNLFQCKETNMPEYDPSSSSYVCGSDALNASMYSWLAVTLCGILFVLMSRNQIHLLLACPAFDKMKVDSKLHAFLEVVTNVSRVCLHITASGVLVLLTTYVAAKSDKANMYVTHTYHYGWITTISYMHDLFPSVLVVTTVCLSSCFVSMRFQQIRTSADSKFNGEWQYSKILRMCGFLFIHMTVTIVVNVLYVFAILVGLSSTKLTALQFAMGSFKLLWNSLYIGWSLNHLPFLSASGRLQLTSAMKIFTFLVSPYVATFLSDSTCFRYVITGSPVVRASFIAQTISCIQDCNRNCHSICGFFIESIATTTSPPWLYSYQCSSALLLNYVPVLIASYLVSGVIFPLGMLSYNLMSSEQVIMTWIPKTIRQAFFSSSIYANTNENKEPSSSIQAQSLLYGTPLFHSHQIMSKLVMNIAVVLTFGFAAPLLSVIVATDTYTNVLILKLRIRRYVALNVLRDGSLDALARLRLETTSVDCNAGLFSSWQLSIVSIAFFWGLFVFDMIGDVYGPKRGSLSVMAPVLCLMCIGVAPVLYVRVRSIKTKFIQTQHSWGVELERFSKPVAIEGMNSDFT